MKKLMTFIAIVLFAMQSFSQIITEGFETGLTIWSVDSSTVGGSWTIVNSGYSPACMPHQGISMLKFDCYSVPAGNWTTISAPINITTNSLYLSYWIYRDNTQYTGSQYSQEGVYVYLNTTPDTIGGTLLSFTPRANTLSGWQQIVINPSGLTTGLQYIVIKGYSQYGNNIYIDDILVDNNSICPNIFNFTAEVASPTSVSFNVQDNNSALGLGFELAYEEASVFDTALNYISVPISAGTTLPYTLSNLSPRTSYSFAIRYSCQGAWSKIKTLTLPGIPDTIPYSTTFADTNDNVDWMLINGTQTNQWNISEAVDPLNWMSYAVPDNSLDGYSLLISDDGGIYNTYTSIPSKVYAVREFYIPQNTIDIKLSFDWRAKGNAAQSDYLRIYWMPVSNSVSAGQTLSPNLQIGNYTGGTGVHWLSNVTEWQHEEMIISSAQYSNLANNTWKLCICWNNEDTNGVSQPPAAIDNLSIAPITCYAPTNINFSNIKQTSVDVSWVDATNVNQWVIQYMVEDSTNWNTAAEEIITSNPWTIDSLEAGTEYKFRMKAVCGSNDESIWTNTFVFETECLYMTIADIPYVMDFNTVPDYSLPSCWRSKMDNTISTLYATTGSLSFNWTWMGGTTTNYIAAISAPIDTSVDVSNLRVRFKLFSDYILVANQSAAYGKFVKVGVMTDPEDWSTFSVIDSVNFTAANTWLDKEVLLTNYVSQNNNTPKYIVIAVMRRGNSPYSVLVDDFSISVIPSCASANLVVSDISSTDALVAWESDAGEWILQYKHNSINSWTDPAVSTNYLYSPDTSFLITGLTSSTTYNVRVMAICNSTDSSEWRQINITTLCAVITAGDLPFLENFDSYSTTTNPIPPCWSRGATITTIPESPYIRSSGSYSSPNSLYFTRPVLGASATMAAFTPAIHSSLDITTLMVRFKCLFPAITATTAVGMVIGISTGNTIFSGGIIPIDTIFITSQESWIDCEVRFDSYTNTNPNANKYIVISTFTGGSGNLYCQIDDFEIDYAPDCAQPSNLFIMDTTANTATISWTSSADSWQVRLDNNSPVDIQTNSFTFTNLQPCHTYTAFIRAVCSDGNSSWNQIQFTTASLNVAVQTLQATNVTSNSAMLNSTVDAGCNTILTQGYKWKALADSQWQTITNGSNLSNLTPLSEYMFYAFATTATDTIKGSTLSFTTLPVAPITVTNAAIVNNSNCTSVTLVGTLANTGIPAATEFGFVYGISTPVELGLGNTQSIIADISNNVAMTANITDLEQSNLYYYNTYALNVNGTYTYGNEQSFSTCNGLEDISVDGLSISLYPNPAKDKITLCVMGMQSNTHISISDLTGKIIYTKNIKANEVSLIIDVKDFVEGIYYLNIRNDETFKSKKITVIK